MKARNENGQIKTYGQLPNTWKNYDNFRAASVEVLEAEGFFDVLTPEYDPELQYIGPIYFDEVNQVFTYPVIDRVFDLDELKGRLVNEFDVVLNDFAVIIARCRFIHDPVPQGLQDVIDLARNTRLQTLADIEALSTVEEALAFRIRQEDVDALKGLFKPYM